MSTDTLLQLELDPRSSAPLDRSVLQPCSDDTASLKIERAGHVAYVHVPDSHDALLPLLVVMHGAGKDKVWNLKESVQAWAQRAKRYNILVLYPASFDSTWDYIRSRAREDLNFIQFSINGMRRAFNVDDSRIALCGISDGGSMALSLATHNPGLFQVAMSVSAGFCAGPPPVRSRTHAPKLFVKHGAEDKMFPLKRIGLRLQDKLKQAGYTVEFRIGKGQGHIPPAWQVEFLADWLTLGTDIAPADFEASLGPVHVQTSSDKLGLVTADATNGSAIDVLDKVPAVGDLCHLDRKYTFTSLGDFTNRAKTFYILTSNEDKSTPADQVMWKLSVSVPALVHLNFRSERHVTTTGAVEWLKRDGWKRVDMTSTVSTGSPGGPYQGPVYSKEVNNQVLPLMGSNCTEGTYFVFVELKSAVVASTEI